MDYYSLDKKLKDIESFAELEEGWYDNWGDTIPKETIEFAKKICVLLHNGDDTKFQVFPSPHGSVDFDWGDGRSIEISDISAELKKIEQRVLKEPKSQ